MKTNNNSPSLSFVSMAVILNSHHPSLPLTTQQTTTLGHLDKEQKRPNLHPISPTSIRPLRPVSPRAQARFAIPSTSF